MPIYNRIAEFQDDLIATRRDIHENPELGFEENRTSDLVAKQLESWGIEVHRDIAKTGLVGVLKGNGDSSRTIGIRADMDALPMSEEGTPIYKSKNELNNILDKKFTKAAKPPHAKKSNFSLYLKIIID